MQQPGEALNPSTGVTTALAFSSLLISLQGHVSISPSRAPSSLISSKAHPWPCWVALTLQSPAGSGQVLRFCGCVEGTWVSSGPVLAAQGPAQPHGQRRTQSTKVCTGHNLLTASSSTSFCLCLPSAEQAVAQPLFTLWWAPWPLASALGTGVEAEPPGLTRVLACHLLSSSRSASTSSQEKPTGTNFASLLPPAPQRAGSPRLRAGKVRSLINKVSGRAGCLSSWH